MKNKNYIRHAPYFRNSIAYIMIFGSACVKWYDRVVFFIFSKFWFSGLLRGGRLPLARKWQKILSVSLSISGTGPHMIVVFGTHVKWWYLQHFFLFFKILIFWVFQRSSLDAQRKFWGVPHLLYMCVIFFLRRQGTFFWEIQLTLSLMMLMSLWISYQYQLIYLVLRY